MELSFFFENIENIILLSEDDKNLLESLVEIVSFKSHEMILEEGKICKYEYYVLKGCLRSFYLDKNGMEHTTLFAVEGWWTGNLRSFVKSIPSDFSIQASEKSMVMRIQKRNIETLYVEIPQFERYFRILLQNRLLATQDRVSKHLSSTAFERYVQFITKYPKLEQRVPAKHIASYLGITPTYLSRLRKKRVKENF